MWLELGVVVVVGAGVRYLLQGTGRGKAVQGPDGEEVKPFSAIPGPRYVPLVGAMLDWYRNDWMSKFHLWMERRTEEYGPILRESAFGTHLVLITGTDLIEELARKEAKYPMLFQIEMWKDFRKRHGQELGILSSSGEQWKKLRSPWNHTMLKSTKVFAGIEGLNDINTDLIKVFRQKRDATGFVKNLDVELFKWSLESACYFLMEERLSVVLGDSKAAERFIKSTHVMFESMMEVINYPPWLARYLSPGAFWRHDAAMEYITEQAQSLVDKKIAEMARDEEEGVDPTGFLSSVIASRQLSPPEISAALSEIMAAAVETTSITMQFILHELARCPDVQAKVYDEILEVTRGAHPTAEHLKKMDYLKATVREIQRLYPVAMGASRVVQEDTVIGGYLIPAQTSVFVDAYANGRKSSNFSDPLSVKPERWLKGEGAEDINTYASVIFGYGARGCIGRKTAETEMHILVIRLLQCFELKYGGTPPLEVATTATLVPKHPIQVFFTERA